MPERTRNIASYFGGVPSPPPGARSRPPRARGDTRRALRAEMGGSVGFRIHLSSLGFDGELVLEPELYYWWMVDAGVPSELPGGVYPIRRILAHPARTLRQSDREAGSVASEGGGEPDGDGDGDDAPSTRKQRNGAHFRKHALTADRVRDDPRRLFAALEGKGDSAATRRRLAAVVNDLFVRQGWWYPGDAAQLGWLALLALERLDMPHEHMGVRDVLRGDLARAWGRTPADAATLVGALPCMLNAHTRVGVVPLRPGAAAAPEAPGDLRLTTAARHRRACNTLLNVCLLAKHSGSGPGSEQASEHAAAARAAGLTSEQRAALDMVLRSQVAILTGAGGTGKTHTIGAIVATGFFDCALVLSPTHRVRQAALRAAPAEALRASGPRWLSKQETPPRLACRTLHWAVFRKERGGETMLDAYMKCRERVVTGQLLDGSTVAMPKGPGPCLVVVEEASMASAEQLALVLRTAATKPCVHVLLVGDPHQLPPVKARGMPLVDLIAAGTVPTVRLTRNHRSSTGLLRFLAGMRRRPPADGAGAEFTRSLADADGAVALHKGCGRSTAAIRAAVAIVRGHLAAGGRMWHDEAAAGRARPSVMVVCPTNRLCAEVARELRAGKRSAAEFVRGQAVLMTENTAEFKNGDGAEVLATHPGRTFDGKRALTKGQLEVWLRSKGEAPRRSARSGGKGRGLIVRATQVKPADAITIHGAQGAEADRVLVVAPLGEGAHMLDRPLLYTAMSRAKSRLDLVGPRSHFSTAGCAGRVRTYATVVPAVVAHERAQEPVENVAGLLLCAGGARPSPPVTCPGHTRHHAVKSVAPAVLAFLR